MLNELTLITTCIDCKSCDQVPSCPIKAPVNSTAPKYYNQRPYVGSGVNSITKENIDKGEVQDIYNLLSGIKELRSLMVEYMGSST